VQVAQMDHCRKSNGRSDTLQWLLGMLKPDQSEDIRFALVSGLGTLLKRFEQTETKDGIMLVAAEDEPVLLGALKQSANGVVVEALADLKAYSDGLIDWALNESSLIAEGVWPMRHLLHVFCNQTATSGNQGRADQLGQQLFGRVHARSEVTFEEEQDDVLKGLDMICQAMRDDRLPLFLNLLQSGEVKQQSRVMQVAAELGLQFVSKSCESLDTLAQALLSGVVEGSTLADLMESGSLLAALLSDESARFAERRALAALQSDESDRKHESDESAKVFVYLMESLGPSADHGIEAPKRVVDFLVEFEKNHLAAAAAATAAAAEAEAEAEGKAAAAGYRNEIKAIEKSKETNPEEKWTEEHSEHLSLESLAAAVEDFTPRDLTLTWLTEKPLNLYCAARLWATSGLLQERASEDIAACLSLSESMAKEAKDVFTKLQGLKEPWVSGHDCKDGRWLQNVLEGMRDETQCLGRFMFTSFLEYIRERHMKDMSGSGMEEIEEQVKEWQPSGARVQLEQQLLLKEVRIGRRSQELPSWTGVVSDGKETGAMSAGVGESQDLSIFEHLLNDIPLVTLEEAAKKMDKVEFFHGTKQLKTTFHFRQVRKFLRNCVVWAESKGQAPGQELYDAKVALQAAMGSMGVEGLAALRAWTCTPMCYVLTSVMRSPGRSRKSMDPVLAYAKLLFKSLHALPARFIFVGTLYRSETGVMDTWQDKKDRLDKKEAVCHNFYAPTSFSIEKQSAASFKEHALDSQDDRTYFTLHGAAGYYLKEFSLYPGEEELLVEPVCCCTVLSMEIPQEQYPGENLRGLHTMELRVRPGVRLLLFFLLCAATVMC
jgi:hypothetical protein